MRASAEAGAPADTGPESPDHYLLDHCIDGRALFPATGYLCLVWRTLAHRLGLSLEQVPVVFEGVTLHQATILPRTGEGVPGGVPLERRVPPALTSCSTGTVPLEVQLLEASRAFEISQNGNLIVSGEWGLAGPGAWGWGLALGTPRSVLLPLPCTGKVSQWEDPDPKLFEHPADLGAAKPLPASCLTQADIYKELRLHGYDYGPHFQGILEATLEGRRDGHQGALLHSWGSRAKREWRPVGSGVSPRQARPSRLTASSVQATRANCSGRTTG